MKRVHFLIILVVFSTIALVNTANGNSYERYFSRIIDGKEMQLSYSEALQATSTVGLSERALDIHKKALSVYQSPDDENVKISYLKAFPIKFDEFLAIFHPPKFNQLYDGAIYIHLFRLLTDEYPNLAAPSLFALVKDACFDADAPSYLRATLRDFNLKYSELYNSEFEKLSEHEKNNVDLYLKASFHPRSDDERKVLCSF